MYSINSWCYRRKIDIVRLNFTSIFIYQILIRRNTPLQGASYDLTVRPFTYKCRISTFVSAAESLSREKNKENNMKGLLQLDLYSELRHVSVTSNTEEVSR